MADSADGPMLVLGTMSGTSCDGLDLALCAVSEDGRTVRLLEFVSRDYPAAWAEQLRGLGALNPDEVRRLEAGWTAWVLESVEGCLKPWSTSHGRPALLGFSGHTWYHDPGGRGTAAIGDASLLAEKLDMAVVADYRTADVEAGGQGAPLVPLFDALAFPGEACCVNLGGIVNLTMLPPASEDVIAWDVAGCNLLLNRQALRGGRAFDEDGRMAASGTVVHTALEALGKWSHLKAPPPKSLAAEDLDFLHGILDGIEHPSDALATAVEWIALTVAAALRNAAVSGSVMFTGGGVHNPILRDRIVAHLPEGWSVNIPDQRWVDGKEAAAFAWLAWRTAHGRTTSLASVTGAAADVCGGTLFGNFAATGNGSVPR